MRLMTLFILVVGMTWVNSSGGQETTESPAPASEEQALFEKFQRLLDKSALVGHFMVDGDENQNRRKERYEIRRVTKLERGDYWNFFARITYGDHDVTVPIPVEVKWAGTTPVITVDELTIPGMGTFDARVVISDNKYAGTWRHGKVGGLMFGHIEKQKEDAAEESDSTSDTDSEDNSGAKPKQPTR